MHTSLAGLLHSARCVVDKQGFYENYSMKGSNTWLELGSLSLVYAALRQHKSDDRFPLSFEGIKHNN